MAEKNVAVQKGQAGRETTAPTTAAQTPLNELRRRMDRMFEDFMSGWPSRLSARDFWDFEPFQAPPLLAGRSGMVDVRFDVAESEDAIEIAAELPGLDESDVEVTLSDGIMNVKGEKRDEAETKEKDYYLSERRYGSFMRSFHVPESVDEERIKATFEKGVLKITLPKRPEAKSKAKRIEISKP